MSASQTRSIQVVIEADAKALWAYFQQLPRGSTDQRLYVENELSRGGGMNGPVFNLQATNANTFLYADPENPHRFPEGIAMALVIAGLPAFTARNVITACMRFSVSSSQPSMGALGWDGRVLSYQEDPLNPYDSNSMDDSALNLSATSISGLSFDEALQAQGKFEATITINMSSKDSKLLDEQVDRFKTSEFYQPLFDLFPGLLSIKSLSVDGSPASISSRSVLSPHDSHSSVRSSPVRRHRWGQYDPVPGNDPSEEKALVPSQPADRKNLGRSFLKGAGIALGILALFVVVSAVTYGAGAPVLMAFLAATMTSVVGASVGTASALAFIGLGGGVKVLKDHHSEKKTALVLQKPSQDGAASGSSETAAASPNTTPIPKP
jgi:hypothetical protein